MASGHRSAHRVMKHCRIGVHLHHVARIDAIGHQRRLAASLEPGLDRRHGGEIAQKTSSWFAAERNPKKGAGRG